MPREFLISVRSPLIIRVRVSGHSNSVIGSAFSFWSRSVSDYSLFSSSFKSFLNVRVFLFIRKVGQRFTIIDMSCIDRAFSEIGREFIVSLRSSNEAIIWDKWRFIKSSRTDQRNNESLFSVDKYILFYLGFLYNIFIQIVQSTFIYYNHFVKCSILCIIKTRLSKYYQTDEVFQVNYLYLFMITE